MNLPDITPIQKSVKELVVDACMTTVVDSESQSRIAQFRNLLKAKLDFVESKEYEFTVPLNQTLKKIRDVFRPVKSLIAEGILHCNEQLSQYEADLKAQETEAQRLLDEQAEAEFNEQMANDKPALPVPVSQHITIDRKVDGLSMIPHWEVEIVDIDKVPRFYLLPNMSLLNKVANKYKGEGEIPGTKFIYKPYPRGR